MWEMISVTLAVAIYANLITFWFQPLQTLKDKIGTVGDFEIINCPKCAGLWLGLIVGFVFYDWTTALVMAPITSLLSWLIFQLIAKYDG